MHTKNIIKIINEEIGSFDFLGNEQYLKEQETIDLLKNEEFQKQFICDSLLNKNTKIKIKVNDLRIGGDYEENFDDASSISIDYDITIQYLYDQTKEPATFNLTFYSDDIKIRKDGWYDQGRFGGTPDTDIEPSGEAWLSSLDWDMIDVNLSTIDGDDIPFIAFQKAPYKIQMLFIRDYTADLISHKTNLDIDTPEMKERVQNVQYC